MKIITFVNSQNNGVQFGPGMNYFLTTADGLDGPDVTLQTQQAAFQDGATFIDALYEPRVIEISGAINSFDIPTVFQYRKTLQQVLSSKIGPGLLTLQNDRGTFNIPAIPTKVSLKDRVWPNPFWEFLIDFNCPNPYWIDPVVNQIQMITLVPLLKFPVTFPVVMSQYVGAQGYDAFNAGDVPCPVKINFYGPATNPKITNQTTGQFIKIAKTLAAGDLLQIDTSFETTSIIYTPSGGSPSNGMGFMSTTPINGVIPSFWQLACGHNTLSFSDDAANTTDRAIITWQNRYIGV